MSDPEINESPACDIAIPISILFAPETKIRNKLKNPLFVMPDTCISQTFPKTIMGIFSAQKKADLSSKADFFPYLCYRRNILAHHAVRDALLLSRRKRFR